MLWTFEEGCRPSHAQLGKSRCAILASEMRFADPASAAPQCPIANFAILRVGWCATSVPKALSKSLISYSSPREHQILKDQAGLPGMDLALESIRDTSDDLMVAR